MALKNQDINRIKDSIKDLVDIIKILRDPKDGCPWDIKQTHFSLISNMIEESYELVDAIISEDKKEICIELGDVFLQVLLHSQIAFENNEFSLADVFENLSLKIKRRHPHIFEKKRKLTNEQLKEQWALIKKSEKSTNKKKYELPKKFPASVQSQFIAKDLENMDLKSDKLDEIISNIIDKLKYIQINLKDEDKIKQNLEILLFDIYQFMGKFSINPEYLSLKTNRYYVDMIEKKINE